MIKKYTVLLWGEKYEGWGINHGTIFFLKVKQWQHNIIIMENMAPIVHGTLYEIYSYHTEGCNSLVSQPACRIDVNHEEHPENATGNCLCGDPAYCQSADCMGGSPGDVSEKQSSFSKLSIASPTSQIILQPLPRFTYATAHAPTLPLLHLRHSSFSNPSFASPTSQDFHLRHLASRPWLIDI